MNAFIKIVRIALRGDEMKKFLVTAATLGWIIFAVGSEPSKLSQRVLYIGNAKTPRAKEFSDFLRQHFASVEVGEREGFDPKLANGADVVLLDWSQSDPRSKPLH